MKSIADTLERITDSVFFCPEIKLFVRKRRIRNMCESIKNKLQVFLEPDNLVCWCEYNNNIWSLCSIPKDLSKRIYTNLWDREVISILTSGTLSANNSFSLMKHRLGIDNVSADKIAETSKKSPFNYKENALIYIPEYIPFPNVKREGYIKAITSEIDRLIKATYGHSLILFTSYRLMEIVFNAIYVYPDNRIEIVWNYKEKIS